MGKEARIKDSKKKEIRNLGLSDRERFQLLQWQNSMLPGKSHSDRRQVDQYFTALNFDEFLTEDTEMNIMKMSSTLEPFPLENMMLDYMKDQLEKEPPQGVMINVHTQRAVGVVRDRIVKLLEEPSTKSEGNVNGVPEAADAPEASPDA